MVSRQCDKTTKCAKIMQNLLRRFKMRAVKGNGPVLDQPELMFRWYLRPVYAVATAADY